MEMLYAFCWKEVRRLAYDSVRSKSKAKQALF